MWRRGLIRFVLACNWCVAGVSFGMAYYAHPHIASYTGIILTREESRERNEPELKDLDEHWRREDARAAIFMDRIQSLNRSGQNAWWLACIASTCTAVLLMIAFPKKTE
jgi:hypothetical protein